MKNYYITLLFATFSFLVPGFAQPFTPPCGSPPPTGADFCEFTCVYCEIDGFTGVNLGGLNTNEFYCNQLEVDNAHWIAFVAGTSQIGFEITPSFCSHGDGLQAAILESCGQDALVCNAGAAGTGNQSLFLTYNQFVPGKTYYMLIDGYLADTCEFGIHVVSGSTGTAVFDAPGIPQGPSAISCTSFPVTYSIAPVAGAGYYHWTVPVGASINGLSNDEILPAATGHSVSIALEYQNNLIICVSVGNTCSTESVASCLTVNVTHPITTVLPPLTIPFNDLPYVWPVDNNTVLTMSGVSYPSLFFNYYQGCDSVVTQVITVLPPSAGSITGTVYLDANNNGVKDFGELPFTNGAVLQSSSGALTNSGINGSFSFTGQNPGDTIRAIAPMPGITVKPAFRIVQNGVSGGYNFGFFTGSIGYDLKVTLNATILRPGFNSWLTINCQNVGTALVSNAEVTLSIPAALQYIIATLNPSNINGNDYTWFLGDLAPGQIRTIQVQIITPVGTSIGNIFNFSASITPVADDQHPPNNFYSLPASVLGSFDPNDKQVNPAFVTPGLLANGAPFEYTIRFQNTGNYPADFVRIVDTLGALVDPASFQFIASSHPCSWKIRGSGVVEFLFDNILLPDSTLNEAESHGFVKFSIKPKKNLALGTVIRNFCDIYFDFNSPVRTNTAGTQVVYFLPGDGLASQDDAMIVRPNPSAFFARCDWKTPAPEAGRIRLFDVTGLPRLERSVEAGQSSVQLNVSALPPGLYFVVLEAGNLILTNKLVRVALLPLGWN